MNDIVISVKQVSKDFKLPHEKTNSIKSGVVNVFQKRGKKIETQHALRDISFDIRQGEFFGIVGRNGSGKSTLLKIIAGIYKPTKGTVTVSGKLVPFIELGVGFNPELTGRENVYLNGALLGFSKAEVDRMYDDIVEFAELGKFMDQKLKNYSSGMQVRLAFSVAIRAEGDILVLDEVLAVGDAAFQKKCFDYFRSLKKNKKTVVFVSHDMGAVQEYCDRAVMIEKNKLIAEGSSEDIARMYKKMFLSEQVSVDDKNNDNKRWGDKSLTFSAPKISKKNLKDEDNELELRVSVKANVAVELPVFGFSIKSAMGQPLIGMNNRIKGKVIKSMDKDDRIDLVWTIPNIFSNGMHYIDLAAEYFGGSSVGERWEGALSFDVNKEEQTRNLVSPSIDLELNIQSSR